MIDDEKMQEVGDFIVGSLIETDADIMVDIVRRLDSNPDTVRDTFLALSVAHLARSYDVLAEIRYGQDEIVDTLTRLLSEHIRREKPRG